MLKKACLIIILVQTFLFGNFQYSLKDYIEFTSKHNKINILVSDNIDASLFNFYTEEKDPVITIDMLKKILKSLNMSMLKYDDFYFISLKEYEGEVISLLSSENSLYKIDLKFNSKDDITNLLSLYDVNATYISGSNEIYFTYKDDSVYNLVLSNLKNIDISPKQLGIKITILETNLNDIKERGSEISSYMKSLPNETYNLFLNLITMPYNAVNNVTSSSKGGFYGVLKFLDTKGLTRIKSSPFLLLRNSKELYFSSVENIPYLKENKEFTDNRQSTTSSYEYKDVGLKVKILPLILDDDSVDLNLDLIIENVLNSNNDKPRTSKKELRSSYIIKRGELLVLSGINQTTAFDDNYEVPLLSKIWLLGNIFKYSKKEIKNSTLTISIEII